MSTRNFRVVNPIFAKISIFDKHFYFWQNFRQKFQIFERNSQFSTKIQNFRPKFQIFDRNFKFSTEIPISGRNFKFLTKISNFWQKFQIFDRNFKFVHRNSNFNNKRIIEFLVKNYAQLFPFDRFSPIWMLFF